MYRMLRDQDVDLLQKGVLEVLERVGFHVNNREILLALKRIGARVDLDQHRARFPAAMTDEFVAAVRAEDKRPWAAKIACMGENAKTVYSGWVPYEQSPELAPPYAPHLFHQLATYYYDDARQQRRKGNRDDFIYLIKFGDMLHPDAGSGHSLNLTEVDPAVEPLEAAICQLEYSHNPRGVYVQDVRQIDYLQEIEEIFGISDPYWHWLANICTTSPLKLDKLAAERYVHMLKSGRYPAKLAAMPVSGVNMPVTTGGSAVVVAAEFVAMWMAARAIAPDVPLTGLVISATLDMHQGQVAFGVFDALSRRIATAEFLRAWTGIEVSPSIGEWTVACQPGMFAALEKAYVAMVVAAFTGFHPEVGMGHLESGLTLSPVQLLIEREFTSGLRFLQRPVVDEESLGLEVIEDIGFGFDRSFLPEEHTASRFRNESWRPAFFSRNGWTPEQDQRVKENALHKVQELVAAYRKPVGLDEPLARAKAVLERARRELRRA